MKTPKAANEYDDIDEFDDPINCQCLIANLNNCDNVWTSWVSAGPFRAWLGHLAAGTGYTAEAVAIACNMPPATGRALAHHQRAAKHIRWIDAHRLLNMDIKTLEWLGKANGETGPAHRALSELGTWRPEPAKLAAKLGISLADAQGLLNGTLRTHQRAVLWHCIAYAQDIMYKRTRFGRGKISDLPAAA